MVKIHEAMRLTLDSMFLFGVAKGKMSAGVFCDSEYTDFSCIEPFMTGLCFGLSLDLHLRLRELIWMEQDIW